VSFLGQSRVRSRSAFTLIELLTAVAIIVILTSFLVPQVSVLRRKSYIQNSRAFIKSIETALKLYFDQFRDYPPDAFDEGADNGYVYKDSTIELGSNWADKGKKAFKNTGCLVYFLCLPVKKISIVGSTVPGETSIRDLRISTVGPFLTEIRATNFSVSEFTLNKLKNDPAGNNINQVEMVDAWGRPLEYDKITSTNGYFSSTRFSAAPFTNLGSHWPDNAGVTGVEDVTVEESNCGVAEALDSVFDPRRKLDEVSGCIDRTAAAAPKNAGGFDLWSHGQLWTDPTDDLGTWNIN
jgi:prepilin-type N-terminal cleavage/methylation domain-containing protein